MVTKLTQLAQTTDRPADRPIEKAILLALREGNRNRGQLADLIGQPYSLLVPALNALLSRGLIESCFQTEENLPVLTYQLRSPNPVLGKVLPPPPPPFNPRLKQL